jgi:hypothetical protein
MELNIYAAWIAFLMGGIAGAMPGLFIHNKEWMGGYASWIRRMIRLGHISFFGLGLLNLMFVFTFNYLGIDTGITIPSVLLIIGLFTMPLVCYLSAWKLFFKNLFFIPASSVIFSIILILWRIL